MIFDFITIIFLGIFLIIAVYTVIKFLERFPERTIEDVIPYLRATGLEELQALLDPAVETNFRLVLPRREFSQLQRKRIHLLRECLLRISHNARVLIEWGNLEWQGEEALLSPNQEK